MAKPPSQHLKIFKQNWDRSELGTPRRNECIFSCGGLETLLVHL